MALQRWHKATGQDKVKILSLTSFCYMSEGVAGREKNSAMIMFINVLWNLSLDMSLNWHIFTSCQQNRLVIQYWILYCPTVCSLSISTLRAQTRQTQQKLKQYCIRPYDFSFPVPGSLVTPGSTRATEHFKEEEVLTGCQDTIQKNEQGFPNKAKTAWAATFLDLR